MEKFREGQIEFSSSKGKISKKLDVFYNPDKAFDRDLNVIIIKQLKKKYGLKTGLDLLAASGVRGLRLAKECGLEMSLNDLNPKAYKLIQENAKLNGLKTKVFNDEANRFLRERKGKFDYVDVDPFGPPVKYLEGAVIKVNPKGGVFGVTATDSSALCGSYPKACLRKYGSKPLKTKYCHELGLRILIKTCVEAGARYDLSLKPLFSYSRRDYFRVYFFVKHSAEICNELVKNVGYWQHNHKTLKRGVYRKGEKAFGKVCGPIWIGGLWDNKTIKKLPDTPFLKTIKDECSVNSIGFYHLPNIFSKTGKSVKVDYLIEKLKEKGFDTCRTHFDPQGIRTDAGLKEIIHLMK
jgi:tRNA (guanine26-N2/guanine27-N2)-dimethyltransferase